MWIILCSIFVIIIIAAVAQTSSNSKKEKTNLDILNNKTEGLNFDQKIIGFKNRYVFGVDELNNTINYITTTTRATIPFKDIISVELIEDGSTILKKSTTRTIGGAVIGGVLAGGLGAVVGGLSGSSTQKDKISKVNIKILLRNIKNPVLLIDCFDSKIMTTEKKSEISKSKGMESYIYKECKKNADEILDILKVIIDLTDSSSDVADIKIEENKPVFEDTFEYTVKSLKEEGKLIDAVQLCINERKMGFGEASDFVKNI